MLRSFPYNWDSYLVDVRNCVILGGSRVRHVVCRLVVAAMLFAQAIGIAQACIEVSQSPTMAFEDANHEGDCEKTVNQNACLQQYTAGDQSTTQVQVVVAEMPRLAVLTISAAFDPDAKLVEAVFCPAHSPDPPPSIRFCSFQI